MRIGKNYSAWNLHHSAFPEKGELKEKLLFFVRCGILAPSSHNCQPWKFEIVENTIHIFGDAKKQLAVADPDNKLMYTSIGCVIENIETAAEYFDFETTTAITSGDTLDAAVVAFTKKDSNVSDRVHRFHTIANRETNRNKFLSNSIPVTLSNFIKKSGDEKTEIVIISDQEKRRIVTDILFDFRINAFSNKLFRYELALYKRNNYTKRGTGIPGFTMGFSNVFSLFAPTAIRYMNVMRFLRKSEKELLSEYTPHFVFVCSNGNEKADWIQCGRIFQRISLEALTYGIHTAYNSMPPKEHAIQEIIGSDETPRLFFRIGYPEKISGHSPRQGVAEFLNI